MSRPTATVTAGIEERPLDIPGALSLVATPEAGAVASFLGMVRETSSVEGERERSVVRLEYDAHPTLAAERLTDIAREAATKWGLARVAVRHRTGTCELGEPTVVVVCSAAHRHDALEACRWVIDEVKASVPIWKKEIYADGSGTWIKG